MSDIAITLNKADLSVLSTEERAMTGWTHVAKIKAADYLPGTAAAANDTMTLKLFTAPAGTCVTKAMASVTTGFETAVTATVGVGISTDPDAYIDEFDPATAGQYNTKGYPYAGASGAAAVDIVVTFTPETGADMNSENTGVLYVYLRLDTLITW
jgi:hypothetical protein